MVLISVPCSPAHSPIFLGSIPASHVESDEWSDFDGSLPFKVISNVKPHTASVRSDILTQPVSTQSLTSGASVEVELSGQKFTELIGGIYNFDMTMLVRKFGCLEPDGAGFETVCLGNFVVMVDSADVESASKVFSSLGVSVPGFESDGLL